MAGFSTLAPLVFPSGTASSDWYGLCCFLANFLCFPNSPGIESWCSLFNILSFLQCYLPLSPRCLQARCPSCTLLAHSVCRQSLAGWVSSGAYSGLFINFWMSYLSRVLCSSHMNRQVCQELWIPPWLWADCCWCLSDPRLLWMGMDGQVWRGCWGGTSSANLGSAELLH